MKKNIYAEMLKDERKAPGDYYKLMKKVKSPQEKRVIKSIIRDERKHFRLLTKLKKRR